MGAIILDGMSIDCVERKRLGAVPCKSSSYLTALQIYVERLGKYAHGLADHRVFTAKSENTNRAFLNNGPLML